MVESPARQAAAASFSLDDWLAHFEQLVYAGLLGDAAQLLARILPNLRRGTSFSNEHVSAEARIAVYTRLAAAITTLLAHPHFQVSERDFDLIAVEHSVFSTIFAVSGFGNSDHLLKQLGTRDPDNPGKINFSDPVSLPKVLLCYSLDSEIELDFEAFARQLPRYAFPAFLGMLSEGMVLSQAAHRRREKLLQLGPLFEHVELAEHMLLMVSAAYMMSSYATSENKHAIKRHLNRLMRRLIESQIRLPETPARRPIEQRPTILLPVEWFNSAHAVYRVFAPSILQLKSRFRLVMIGHAMCMDEASKAHFDEVIELPNALMPIADVIEHVRRAAPDVILFPSVGMMMECVALSSIRLAPIQVAMIGHPATTHSDAIDYMLVDGQWPGDPSRFSETVMVQQAGSTAFNLYPNANFPKPQIREEPSPLRIAVPSSILKLNAPFLSTCQAIARKARRQLEFHFFPSVTGLSLFRVTHEIRRWLPHAVVHPQCHYDEYLRILNQCDIHLSPFPFGGTNSNIDSMRLAIPMLTLLGSEPPGQIDAAMMRRAELPEWLITANPAEYEQAALRLIDSDSVRVTVARQLASTNVIELFTKIDSHVPQNEFLRVMTFIYENHESIQASGRRYWLPGDREQFRATGNITALPGHDHDNSLRAG